MGHHISAVLFQGPFDEAKARSFDLQPIGFTAEITLFPLDTNHCDYWAERLGIEGSVSDRPLLNCRVVHLMIGQIAPDPLFAIIETDYVGGNGDQAAAVYRAGKEVMAPQVSSRGPINQALRHLGVRASSQSDEFDTVGLGHFRDFYDYFEPYHD